mmetsp:Transcript_17831/g.51103  ORF Transcript_17831/g.51103 Transcript_17831/m.51103 type:complete len:722 (-) Transcript_17831:1178-3343(-)
MRSQMHIASIKSHAHQSTISKRTNAWRAGGLSRRRQTQDQQICAQVSAINRDTAETPRRRHALLDTAKFSSLFCQLAVAAPTARGQEVVLLHHFQQRDGRAILWLLLENLLQLNLAHGPLAIEVRRHCHPELGEEVGGHPRLDCVHVLAVKVESLAHAVIEELSLAKRARKCDDIAREQTHGLHAAFDSDLVNLAAPLPGLGRESIIKVLRQEERRAELLCRGLQPRSHVHIGGQIRRIDLVFGADGSLDGPANVQTHAEADLEVAFAKPAADRWVVLVFIEASARAVLPLQVNDRFEERDECVVAHVACARPVWQAALMAVDLPHEKKRVTDVLVGCTIPRVRCLVNDGAHLVHVDHDLLLQALGGVGEVANVAKPEHGLNLDTIAHWLNAAVVGHVHGYDLGASLAEPDLKKLADLGNGALQQDSLIVLVRVPTIGGNFAQAGAPHGILRKLLDADHHALDRANHELFGIVGEHQTAAGENDHDKDRLEDVESGCPAHCRANVKVCKAPTACVMRDLCRPTTFVKAQRGAGHLILGRTVGFVDSLFAELDVGRGGVVKGVIHGLFQPRLGVLPRGAACKLENIPGIVARTVDGYEDQATIFQASSVVLDFVAKVILQKVGKVRARLVALLEALVKAIETVHPTSGHVRVHRVVEELHEDEHAEHDGDHPLHGLVGELLSNQRWVLLGHLIVEGVLAFAGLVELDDPNKADDADDADDPT